MAKANRTVPAGSSSLTEDDRRARVRYPSQQRTLCQADTAQTNDLWLMGRICELSQTGISLHIGRPFEPGEIVSIEPIQGITDLARVFQARVVHARNDSRGGWILGCEFTQPLNDDELKALL